jgi:hypothetical protein
MIAKDSSIVLEVVEFIDFLLTKKKFIPLKSTALKKSRSRAEK